MKILNLLSFTPVPEQLMLRWGDSKSLETSTKGKGTSSTNTNARMQSDARSGMKFLSQMKHPNSSMEKHHAI
jgi:protein tyrosine/serine phosphatase